MKVVVVVIAETNNKLTSCNTNLKIIDREHKIMLFSLIINIDDGKSI